MEPRFAAIVIRIGGLLGTREQPMLKWALIFLVIALIAGIFGFTGVEEASASIARILFGIFLILFLGALVTGLWLGHRLIS
jgi:uncharacterized membrane protein YtjA (UPF0391 family)